MKKIIFLLICIAMIPTLSATPRKVANQYAESHTMEKTHHFINRLGQKQIDRVATTVQHAAQQQSEEITLEFTKFSKEPKYYSSGDWYVVLENEDDWEVYLNWKAPQEQLLRNILYKGFSARLFLYLHTRQSSEWRYPLQRHHHDHLHYRSESCTG